MIYRILIAFCLFIFIISSSYGQRAKFVKGYVVLTSGDTIRGEIKKLLPTSYSEAVIFRENSEVKAREYSPDELDRFFFAESNYYESDSIPFVTLKNDLQYKRLFIKKLLTGDIDLYRLDIILRETIVGETANEDRFYFYREKGKSQLVDLLEYNYKQKIKAAFRKFDCKPNPKLNYRFNDIGLTNLVTEYNNCRGGKTEKVFTIERTNKRLMGVGLSAGLASAKIATNNAVFEDFGLEDYRTRGIDINLFGKLKLSNRIFLRSGLNFKNRSYNPTRRFIVSDLYDNEGEELVMNSSIKINQLSLPLDVLFHFTKKSKIKPYVLAGSSFGIGVSNSAIAEEDIFRNINGELLLQKREVEPYNLSINNFEIAWYLGGGVDFSVNDKVSLFTEFRWTNSFNDAASDSFSRIEQEALILNIGFNYVPKRKEK